MTDLSKRWKNCEISQAKYIWTPKNTTGNKVPDPFVTSQYKVANYNLGEFWRNFFLQNLITVKENLEPDLKIVFISCNEHLKKSNSAKYHFALCLRNTLANKWKTEHFSKADSNLTLHWLMFCLIASLLQSESNLNHSKTWRTKRRGAHQD